MAKISIGDRMSSGIINDLFYPLFVHAKKFYVTNTCISCGKCLDVCPTNNIRMENKETCMGGKLYALYGVYQSLPERKRLNMENIVMGYPDILVKKEMLY